MRTRLTAYDRDALLILADAARAYKQARQEYWTNRPPAPPHDAPQDVVDAWFTDDHEAGKRIDAAQEALYNAIDQLDD